MKGIIHTGPLTRTRNRIRGQNRLVHDQWVDAHSRWRGGIVTQVA
jgi:hypothetical protein